MKSSAVNWIYGTSIHSIPLYGTESHSTHFSLGIKPQMTIPEVMWCPDGHFRCVIYGLGPYIADYPEQALLACVVQGWCTK